MIRITLFSSIIICILTENHDRFYHRDGRLREGDQILAIDGQPLDTNVSHQQAIAILQQARGVVELVVARPVELSETHSPSPSALSDTSKTGSDMVVNKFLFSYL